MPLWEMTPYPIPCIERHGRGLQSASDGNGATANPSDRAAANTGVGASNEAILTIQQRVQYLEKVRFATMNLLGYSNC